LIINPGVTCNFNQVVIKQKIKSFGKNINVRRKTWHSLSKGLKINRRTLVKHNEKLTYHLLGNSYLPKLRVLMGYVMLAITEGIERKCKIFEKI
jgi:hypothetical protein